MTSMSRKESAVAFLSRIVAGDVKGAYERYVGRGFRHHNPWFAGDADSLRKGMEENESTDPGKVLTVRTALEDGDYVAVHSRLTRAASGLDMAVVHIFRFEGDRIVELWDIGQMVPEKVVNENGMF
jgi:predicted SnoaL-like aldol condensation-catalyzing enzyme